MGMMLGEIAAYCAGIAASLQMYSYVHTSTVCMYIHTYNMCIVQRSTRLVTQVANCMIFVQTKLEPQCLSLRFQRF